MVSSKAKQRRSKTALLIYAKATIRRLGGKGSGGWVNVATVLAGLLGYSGEVIADKPKAREVVKKLIGWPDQATKPRKHKPKPSRWSPEYIEHINSSEWRNFREKIFRKRGRMCEDCTEVERLELHHLTYENLGHERDEDVLILCRPHPDHPPALPAHSRR